MPQAPPPSPPSARKAQARPKVQPSIRKLVKDLSNEDDLARREATRELLALGPFARELFEQLKEEGGKPLEVFLEKLDRLERLRDALSRRWRSAGRPTRWCT